MKRILTCCLFLALWPASSNAVTETDDPVKEERDVLAVRRETLAKVDSMPPEQAIPYLGEGLRKMGDPSIYHLREETIPVYDATQQKLLSIPGHAEYFRDKVNAAKEQVRSGEMSLNDWQRLLQYTFGTLKNMPS